MQRAKQAALSPKMSEPTNRREGTCGNIVHDGENDDNGSDVENECGRER